MTFVRVVFLRELDPSSRVSFPAAVLEADHKNNNIRLGAKFTARKIKRDDRRGSRKRGDCGNKMTEERPDEEASEKPRRQTETKRNNSSSDPGRFFWTETE